ncbi:hypothetical protein [Glaciibacter psychrotolerans]|uniref:Uncharacterized protein n=1 Tax=Glaciibacter psychrotolerans TaxID=670054 RepID=A0A7Z0EGE6_9MICO|nr:hypothetical protein [Leifsonia psychrotolerans]NYJ20755.1 hypothetical protein [Leifsonia psychrotolerans]
MRRPAGTIAVGIALAVFALLLASCTVGGSDVPSASASPPATGVPSPQAQEPAESLGTPGAAGCAPASPQRTDTVSGFPEVQGTANPGNTLYGLIMGDTPLRASNTTTKFVWRITGTGDVTVSVKRPDGSAGQLVWGPESHDDSTYLRPGDEWGTGVILNVAGCWEFVVRHGAAQASVYLLVTPPAAPAPKATPAPVPTSSG